MIEITVRDLDTGEIERQEISDDYVVVCAGRRYVSYVQTFANGTAVITIKVERQERAEEQHERRVERVR